MKRLLLALLIVLTPGILPAQFSPLKEEPQFQPPMTLSAQEITEPNCPGVNGARPVLPPCVPSGNGTSVLEAVIADTGQVQRVEVRRDLGHFTEIAIQSIKTWKFLPATMAGKPTESRIPIAVTFRPMLWYVTPVPLPRLVSQTEAAIQAELQPVQVLRAAFPGYPMSATTTGTVVLEVTIDEAGKPQAVTVLRDLPPLTEEAQATVSNWRFMAATLNGRPIPTKIVLAFVFPGIPTTYER